MTFKDKILTRSFLLWKMSYPSRPANVFDPAQKAGVNYFKHVSKALMVPYGKAYGVLTDREVLEKCSLWTCEWLTRPATAVSELGNSLYDNLSTLKAYEGKVFERSAVTFHATKLVPLKHSLQRFNKKDTNVAEEPDDNDLKALMKTMSKETLRQMTKEWFSTSEAIFQMASQMMVLMTLLRHPNVWASKHWEMPEVTTFKANPTAEPCGTTWGVK